MEIKENTPEIFAGHFFPHLVDEELSFKQVWYPRERLQFPWGKNTVNFWITQILLQII